jgi:hypothetical protein
MNISIMTIEFKFILLMSACTFVLAYLSDVLGAKVFSLSYGMLKFVETGVGSAESAAIFSSSY